MNQSQQEFCAALKAARERRGLKLTDIADVTKVCPSYFSALERNDLRVWPKGLFRRSFFRAYAGVVGLPVEPTLQEFLRLFPEDERATAAAAAAAAASTPESTTDLTDCRLVLADSWMGSRTPLLTRLCAAPLDAGIVATLAAAITWGAGIPLMMSFAVTAMTYLTLATLLFAETPAVFVLRHRERIATLVQSLFATAKQKEARTSAEHDEEREWITDARRVRPRGQAPGLRVRFKVSS